MQIFLVPAFFLEDELAGEENGAWIFLRNIETEMMYFFDNFDSNADPVICGKTDTPRHIDIALERIFGFFARMFHFFGAFELYRIQYGRRNEDHIFEITGEKPLNR